MSLSQTKLLVFARAPLPGRCKTRLIGVHGARGAAQIHRALTLRTLAMAKAAGIDIELWCEPDARHGFFRACRERFGARVRAQPAGDLGRKMALALERTLRRGARKVLIVGTDCPALTAEDLHAALRALDQSDVVIQPAEDGGYVLIGARRFSPAALRGIDWSSGRELAQTLRRLRGRGISVQAMPQRWDVDHPTDVTRARRLRLL